LLSKSLEKLDESLPHSACTGRKTQLHYRQMKPPLANAARLPSEHRERTDWPKLDLHTQARVCTLPTAIHVLFKLIQ
jgi:hypothetical protein